MALPHIVATEPETTKVVILANAREVLPAPETSEKTVFEYGPNNPAGGGTRSYGHS